MQELKPCPFCGGEKVFSSNGTIPWGHVGGSIDWTFVECEDCHAKMDGPSIEYVSDKWNTRYEPCETTPYEASSEVGLVKQESENERGE